jgi:hypothetical protein
MVKPSQTFVFRRLKHNRANINGICVILASSWACGERLKRHTTKSPHLKRKAVGFIIALLHQRFRFGLSPFSATIQPWAWRWACSAPFQASELP